ncbi:hypothetical protein ABZP36_005264 [Zizania latifolia]
MIGYVENLKKLGSKLDKDLATDVILQSLPVSFEPFIMNYHMNGMKKTLAELHGMLKTTEKSLKKNPSHMMMVQKESKKRKRKEKAKASDAISSSKSYSARKSKSNPASSDTCHHCHKPGYWRRNCKLYLEEQKKKKRSMTSASGAKKD